MYSVWQGFGVAVECRTIVLISTVIALFFPFRLPFLISPQFQGQVTNQPLDLVLMVRDNIIDHPLSGPQVNQAQSL